jgi:hypothetical protein
MKIEHNVLGAIAVLLAISPAIAATIPSATGVPTSIVITVRQSSVSQPVNLTPADVKVLEGHTLSPVVKLQRLAGDLAEMQLFILLDDSTRSASLGVHLPALKSFVEALPPTTQVAVGYMRNGTFGPVQDFTLDHEKAASALRLPESIPGGNGSPYFALTDLAKRWPSKQPTNRRAVLMLTDGVDRYYGTPDMADPYVDASMQNALKAGVMVYSIYLRGAGLYDRGSWTTNFAQSRLSEVSQETGGHAYFEDFADPVSIAPFLKDFEDRLDNQYQVTIDSFSGPGVHPVKVRSELHGVKIESPTHIYVR